MHFPHGHGHDEEFFRQMTAEEIRTRMQHGFQIRYYKKIRERNEALDCRVYNAAALEILQPNFERLAENMATANEEPEPEPQNILPANPKDTIRRPSRPGGGFVDAWR